VQIGLPVYLAIGAILGIAWNQAEFGRAGVRRLVPSLALAMLAWPVLIAAAALVLTAWSQADRRRRAEDPDEHRRFRRLRHIGAPRASP